MTHGNGKHVHHSHASRCCEQELPEDVLARLRASEPRWDPMKLPKNHPERENVSLSRTGETREQFALRHNAWELAVAREERAAQARRGGA